MLDAIFRSTVTLLQITSRGLIYALRKAVQILDKSLRGIWCELRNSCSAGTYQISSPETLTNIHRHSGSRTVEVRLQCEDGSAQLEVQDYGVGMSREFLDRSHASGVGGGVGLAGMRERVNELGGQLQIVSGKQGTLVTVCLPVPSRVEVSCCPGSPETLHWL